MAKRNLVILGLWVLIALCLFLLLGAMLVYIRTGGQEQARGPSTEAPAGWEWVREGLPERTVELLAGLPDSKEPPLPGVEAALGTWEYSADIAGTRHVLLFSSDGTLFRGRWYQGITADDTLNAPTPTVRDGLVFDYPRYVPMAWDGTSTNGFQVQVDTQYPDGSWSDPEIYFTDDRTMIHIHGGANPGRWRVRKLSAKGYGPWSEYVSFECVR